jgi:hypothetical protein
MCVRVYMYVSQSGSFARPQKQIFRNWQTMLG